MLCEIQFVLRNIHLQEQNNSTIPVTVGNEAKNTEKKVEKLVLVLCGNP